MKCVTLFVALFVPALAIGQNQFDATIQAYRGLHFPCGDSLTPVLQIQNVGTATMSTCVVETWKNGLFINTFNWNLAVPAVPNEVRLPAFPTVGTVAGDVLEFRIISVNGEMDQDTVGNVVGLTLEGEPVSCSLQTVEVEVTTDDLPSETTWMIRDELGQVLAEGGPYTEPSSTETHWLTLPAGACLGLEVKDAGGNGITGGGLTVRCDGADVIQVDGSTLGQEAYRGLIAGLEVGVGEEAEEQGMRIYPNPALGQVMVRTGGVAGPIQLVLFDATGRQVYHRLLQPSVDDQAVDLRSMTPGLYVSVLRSSAGIKVWRLQVE